MKRPKLTLKFLTKTCILLIGFVALRFVLLLTILNNVYKEIELSPEYIFKSKLLSTDDSRQLLVLLVQVHNRSDYLKVLINSLKSVRHINETLLIFSHDYIDQSINDMIQSRVDFCPFMQIFYPYSNQIYVDTFPGNDLNDCPPHIGVDLAVNIKCKNSAYPDTYGNYRDTKFTQIKHHWFWKISYVFDRLRISENDTNLSVLLLEEDYFLMPDTLHILNKLKEKKTNSDIISLSHFINKFQNLKFKDKGNLYEYDLTWVSSKHNTGLYITRDLWENIKNCTNAFCTYDDYNWDWTLQHVIHTCMGSLNAIYPIASRVVHIGACGTHSKHKNCNITDKLDELNNNIKEQTSYLFPNTLINTGYIKNKIPHLKPNGGWSDPRDHYLCKSFIDSKIDPFGKYL